MRAAVVMYVAGLARMSAFYAGCFGLAAAGGEDGFCELESEAWLITLVTSPEALPATAPAPRRTQTPVKLAFAVASIDTARAVVAGLGGRVDPVESEWTFQSTVRCDCVDPEGNVVQLIQASAP